MTQIDKVYLSEAEQASFNEKPGSEYADGEVLFVRASDIGPLVELLIRRMIDAVCLPSGSEQFRASLIAQLTGCELERLGIIIEPPTLDNNAES